MKTILAGLILLFALPGAVLAQGEPILVSLTVLPPYSNDLTIWESNPDKVLIQLTNRTSESYDVRLGGFAENLNGEVRIETKNDFPRNRIVVGPNATVNLNLRALKLFTADAVRIIGGDKTTIARTKKLPEGTYRMCVEALEFTSLERLSPPAPSGCQTFTIRFVEEPRPLLPRCGTTVERMDPQLVNFQWSIPAGAPASTQYTFELAEVPLGWDPNDAIRSKTSPILYAQTTSSPILSYGPGQPPLQSGQRYAWRVQAVDPGQSVTFRNEGYSEVCSFVFGKKTPLIGDREDDIVIGTGSERKGGDTVGSRIWDDSDIVHVKNIRKLDDLLVPTCVSLVPRLEKRPTRSGEPYFEVEVKPRINPDAITGGTIEIWKDEPDKLRDWNLNRTKDRPVFEADFTGSSLSNLKHTTVGESSVLDLMFINRPGARHRFSPDRGVKYRWRFTLRFDGGEIRADGTSCRFDQAVSPFDRFPDIQIKPDRPDTLVAAGFEIVVEKWDESSKSEDASKPSGIGRIQFDCDAGPTVFTPIPWGPDDLKLRPYSFEVVDVVGDSAREFSVAEGRTISSSTMSGEMLTLLMPDRKEGDAGGGTIEEYLSEPAVRDAFIADRNLVVDLFGKNSPDGIRVAFRDVEWEGPVKPKVILTEGIAVYPSPSPVPTPPAQLDLENGFKVDIDTITIDPDEATFEGNLLLPPSIISTDTCTYATVPIPETTITPECEFYLNQPDSSYGPWAIGESGIEVEGDGYVLDFSYSTSPPGLDPPVGTNWKGVKLNRGETVHFAADVVSDRGYTKADYDFTNARIVGAGFAGRLELDGSFRFETLDPYGYEVNLQNGYLAMSSSAIDTGLFKSGSIDLPVRAIARSEMGGKATVSYQELVVQSDMDLFASIKYDGGFAWGERSQPGGKSTYYTLSDAVDTGSFWLNSFWSDSVYYPVNDTSYNSPYLGMPGQFLEAQGIQGATFQNIRNRDFTIHTRDVPDTNNPVKFPKEAVAGVWMNINAQGVHSEVRLRPNKDHPGMLEVGPTWAGLYQADSTPFRILFADLGGAPVIPQMQTAYNPDLEGRTMRVQFVESAVWASSLSGAALLEGPIGMPVLFRDMMFTSTANNAGGDIEFAQDDTLDYWGVELVERDTGRSAGIMAVKMGVIYLTAAGIAERVHFDEPFWLSWGEMEASGNFGRLFFDYNAVGQKFDGFHYATEFVALSPFVTSDTGYIQAYGSTSIPFFGSKMISVSDRAYPDTSDPHFGRYVEVQASAHLGAGASELHWERTWAGGLSDFEWDIDYDTVRQNGFIGDGSVDLAFIDDIMTATIRVTSTSSCFRVMQSTQTGFNLGPVADMGLIQEIWGCGCIRDGTLRQIAVGGYLSPSAGSNILQARTAASVTVTMSVDPDRLVMFANGQMFLNVGGNDIDVFGLTHFTFNWSEGYAEGYFKGTVSLGQVVGIPIVAGANSGISAYGEMSWHIGLDYQTIQGRIGVAMYNMVGGLGFTAGTGTSLETGLFLGINAPKSTAWVMDGINGKFGLNKGGLPTNLTGFYVYLGLKQGVDLFIVSGGYEVYVGVGAFAPSGGVPSGGVFGNFGIYIWGKILGGLVSASAWGNLQLVAAIPPAFHGAVGLEACVLWVFCGSVDVHCGFNKEDGFYLY